VHQLAHVCLSCRIIVPSAWDSAATTMLLLETMISSVQDLKWDETKQRMETLEDMFDQTKLFRKFT
jgi:DNA-binding MurR/RpiR family transcriptional regulator